MAITVFVVAGTRDLLGAPSSFSGASADVGRGIVMTVPVVFVGVVLYSHGYVRRNNKRQRHPFVVRATAIGAVVPFVSLVALLSGLIVFNVTTVVPESNLSLYSAVGTTVVHLLNALGEELVFRRYVFSTLLAYGSPIAYAVTGALFAAVHQPSPFAFFELVIASYVYTYAFRTTSSIWPAVALHLSFNLLRQEDFRQVVRRH